MIPRKCNVVLCNFLWRFQVKVDSEKIIPERKNSGNIISKVLQTRFLFWQSSQTTRSFYIWKSNNTQNVQLHLSIVPYQPLPICIIISDPLLKTYFQILDCRGYTELVICKWFLYVSFIWKLFALIINLVAMLLFSYSQEYLITWE